MWVGAFTSLVGLFLTQCGTTGGGGPLEAGVTEVEIRNFTFTPKAVTIKQGESVRWTNREFVARHTVTSGNPGDADAGVLWDAGGFPPGQTFSRQFDDLGTFVYFCDIHANDPGMRDATVTVETADGQREVVSVSWCSRTSLVAAVLASGEAAVVQAGRRRLLVAA